MLNKDLLYAKSPTLLTIGGLVGLGITIIFTVKNTVKAQRRLDDAWQTLSDEEKGNDIDFTPIEKIKICWPCYIPTMISAGATATAILVSRKLSNDQLKAMSALYSSAQATAALYEKKTQEVLGRKKSEDLKGETIKEQMRMNPPTKHNCYRITNSDNIMYDVFNEIYFYMDQTDYEHRINKLNEQLMHNNCNYISDDEYLQTLDVGSRQYARMLFFDAANGLIEPYFRPEFMDDGVTICTAITYNWPKPEYECPSMGRYHR